MTDIERIRDQLANSLDGDPWHGPSLNRLLANLSPAEAIARPIQTGHTAWELVLHMIAWTDEMHARLSGEGRDLPPEEDWPPQPDQATDKTWQAVMDQLRESTRQLIEALDETVAARLDEPIAEGFDPVYHALYGIIQHNAYHGGQIVLLRKALAE